MLSSNLVHITSPSVIPYNCEIIHPKLFSISNALLYSKTDPPTCIIFKDEILIFSNFKKSIHKLAKAGTKAIVLILCSSIL